ncbi:MAG: type I phosphomannose isomerase catalytic subunit [Acholeplasmataceae bacterium]
MNEILFLEPLFKERIWGGNNLQRLFGYPLESESIGECWGISGHENGSSTVKNGPYAGMTLAEVYQQDRALFAHFESDRFPILTKILDANQDLSVQVHPSDETARKKRGEAGKTECWYVIAATKDAAIIEGHTALTPAHFRAMVEREAWDELFVKRRVEKGDFIYIPAGTVHAIGKGIVVLETQQSSDTTFRLYDYDRRDRSGKKRDLHIDDAIRVATIPHRTHSVQPTVIADGPNAVTRLIETPYFTVEHWRIRSERSTQHASFKLMSVLSGKGSINGSSIAKGDHFIVTAETKAIEVKGDLEVIVSYP